MKERAKNVFALVPFNPDGFLFTDEYQSGIPPEVYAYRLGNRSALEWVIDQYRATKDDHGNITSDPNRLDDEEYIVRLIGRVITVSLETHNAVSALPQVEFD